MQACSFTGNRIIPEAEIAGLSDLLRRAIEYAYSKGCRDFNCGGALGFDTMAALAVLEKREKYPDIRLRLLLPCLSQTKYWSPRDISVYERIKSLADEVIFVSLDYDGGCMHRRNARLVDECEILIAYSSKADGGAAKTLRMAEARGREVYNLYSRVGIAKNN